MNGRPDQGLDRTPRALGAALALLACAAPLSAQLTIEGSVAGGALGSAVAVIGDVDGDGVPDLALGAPDSDAGGEDAGEVRVVSGADGSLLFVALGAGPYDDFGVSVASVGDASGDDVPDVLVGAHQDWDETTGGSFANRPGYAMLLSGADGTVLRVEQGELRFTDWGTFFGESVAGPGDLDGDGLADLAVGDPWASLDGLHQPGEGVLHVYSSADGHLIHELQGALDTPGKDLGRSVAAAGDIDGDGVGDLLLGLPGSNPASGSATPGGVSLLSGATGEMLWIAYGASGTYQKLGTRVASAGDLDGDGLADVLASGDNIVAVYSGVDGAFIRSFVVSNYPAFTAPTISGAGDVNGDGASDYAIGDPLATGSHGPTTGRVRIFSGAEGLLLGSIDGLQAGERFGASMALVTGLPGTDAPALVIGAPGHDGPAGVDAGRVQVVPSNGGVYVPFVFPTPGTQEATGFGIAVALAGDVDNDGWDDVSVGAPYDSTGGQMIGALRVYSGRDGSLLHLFSGTHPFDRMGLALASVGDVDRDGSADILGSAPFAANPAGPGEVRLWSGATGAPLLTLEGLSVNDQFGGAIAAAGDVDLDGVPDILVGAPSDDVAGTNHGAARVFSGATGAQLLQVTGTEANGEFGAAVSGIGDVNADGRPDFVVGARSQDGPAGMNAGRVLAYSGANGAPLWDVGGSSSFAVLGWSVDGVADLSGDGVPDVLVGEPGNDGEAANAGRALVLSGADGSVVLALPGHTLDAGIGRNVAGVGDLDGDGLSELAVGSGNGAGRLEIFDGDDGQLLYEVVGGLGDNLVASLDAGGDVDNDGSADLVIGATHASTLGAPEGGAIVFNLAPQTTPWESAGHVLPGTKGAPKLTGSGPLLPATLTTLALTNAKPGASTALVVGFTALNAPFKGGTLVPYPNVVIQGLPISPAGALTLNAPWPAGLPSGTAIWFQHWFADAAGLQGFAASNAVKAVVP
ncbi:MAG TPA: hypothetical protein VFD43_05010 [Planctomycetota bacterium]|nr:hypothetical protein [Planctomycetota bacterium]